MDPATSLADARLTRFLEEEPVVWLSTVAEDGAPHLVPTWFAWDGTVLHIVSKPGARKARNIAADPRVMLALGDAEDDFDVGMLRATAEVLRAPTPLDLPPGFAAKYGERIRDLGLTPAQFARTYAAHIRIRPIRAVGWHGRSAGSSVESAVATLRRHGAVSMVEPWRAAVRGLLGEPMARPSGA